MNDSPSNEEVLQMDIPWEPYKTTGQLSDKDLAIIRRVDKSTETAKVSVLDEGPAAVFEAFFSVLRNISHQETIQYTLAMLDEMLTLDPDRIADMHSPSPQHPGAPAPDRAVILVRMLERQDWFTQAKAAKLLSLALKTSEDENPAIRSKFLEWLTAQFNRPSNADESYHVASGALAGLLRTRETRQEYSRQVPLLLKCMKAAQEEQGSMRSQVLYNFGLCLWLLSFDDNGMEELKRPTAVVPLVSLLKEGNKEKVMRIALMSLQRVVATGAEEPQSAMVEAGLPRIIRIRSAQTWSDEDILDMLASLDESLNTSVAAMSSFEKYRAEVLSGALDWTPMHTNKQFWVENVKSTEDKDFQIIRCLIKLLETSQDPKVLAVACHDLGRIAENLPQGRFVINNLGGKVPVMAQMANKNLDVSKHALVCVQRLMLGKDKLEFLSKPGGASTSAAVS